MRDVVEGLRLLKQSRAWIIALGSKAPYCIHKKYCEAFLKILKLAL